MKKKCIYHFGNGEEYLKLLQLSLLSSKTDKKCEPMKQTKMTENLKNKNNHFKDYLAWDASGPKPNSAENSHSSARRVLKI